jgi:membrane protease YdiL (CAAX protease family)
VNPLKKSQSIAYLLIAFGLAWILFVLPLAFGAPGTISRQTASLVCWAAAMWAPGIAAILTTLKVDRQPFGSLHLGRLGDKRAYLWAWLLPLALTTATGLLTWLLGAGKLDLEFTSIRQAMAQAAGPQIPPGLVVGLQIAVALTIGPLFNTLFALGEELGWRGYLLPQLLPLGQGRAILFSGVIWGVWHWPAILQGQNYPQYPLPGLALMVVFCVLFGTILSWLYLRTHSPWAPALGHGALNAVAGFPLLFMPQVNMVVGGALTSLIGWIPMIAFIGWLVWSKRLPVPGEQSEAAPS